MDSIKQKLELNAHIEDIYDYIDEKFNDVKVFLSNVDLKYTDILNQISTLSDNITSINDKLTEDTIDRLNNLGTLEDFQQGFIDGVNS